MKKISRREFISTTSKLLATVPLTGVLGAMPAQGEDAGADKNSHPNILLLMVDQMQTPPEGYKFNEGAAQGLKEILGFRSLSPDNQYTRFFPGLLRLRQNAVVMRKHYTASAACVPSRTCIMTGQYSKVTGVDQTDGMYKSAHDVAFLDPKGIPTIGDWFRAVGYTTHYFGKWHVSEADESTKYLEEWGFSDWASSYPEPHGGPADNLGVYRDVIFTEKLIDFLNRKGTDTSKRPWFTVGSLVDPHDCSAWPINWQAPQDTGVVPWTLPPAVSPFPTTYPPPSIPAMGDQSLEGTVQTVDNGETVYRTFSVDLNPDGFPQDNSALPPTFAESLAGKPQCQKDYALKWGLGIGANTNYTFINQKLPFRSPLPFQLQGEYARAWSLSYNQYYFYCQYLVDRQMRQILQALDDNHLTENTIVIFLSDHGDMTGAHGGMIQKWHNAYEEAVRVPMIISSPLVNKSKENMREIPQPTSSIDFAPTVLALAGYKEKEVRVIMEAIHGKSVVKPFVGADLSNNVKGYRKGYVLGPDGTIRRGVFFMTNDMITELGANPDSPKPEEYQAFLESVDEQVAAGLPLARGTVRQPNNVRALCTGDWKIVHYVDPNGVESDEWELYYLKVDPTETTNLVNYATGEVRTDLHVPGTTTNGLRLKNKQLRKELAKQESLLA